MKRMLFYSSLVFIYVTASLLQSSYLLHQDVSSFTEWAARLLEHGSYANNFFETNPPLIIYLSIPPVLFAKYFSINMVMATRFYIFSLASLSLFICYHLSRPIFSSQDNLLRQVFLLVLAFVFLILPLPSFGQREHLVVFLSMPYVLMLAARMQGYSNFALAILIGIMAGFAFAFKPFFLVTPLLIELYYAYCKRSIFACLRVETVTMAICIVIYLIIMLLFHPDYFTVIIPFIYRYYYAGISQPLTLMMLFPPSLLCWTVLVYYFTQAAKIKYTCLTSLLFIEFLSFLIAYLCGRTVWYYHVLPVYSLAIILFSYLWMEQIYRADTTRHDYLYQAICALLLCYSMMTCYFYWYVPPLLILASCVSIFYLLIFIAVYFMKWKKLSCMLTLTLGLMFSIIPLFFSITLHQQAVVLKKATIPMLDFLSTHAKNKSVYYLSTNALYARPLVDMAHAKSASRFPFLWMLPGMTAKTQTNTSQLNQDKALLAEMICNDIKNNEPAYIFVDISKDQIGISKPINYMTYFGGYACFQQTWKNYRFQSTINIAAMLSFYPQVTYQIYERKINHDGS